MVGGKGGMAINPKEYSKAELEESLKVLQKQFHQSLEKKLTYPLQTLIQMDKSCPGWLTPMKKLQENQQKVYSQENL